MFVVVGLENMGISIRLTTVMAPVAVYFLVLGLLNSRRHPQLLSGRFDFAILLAALCPLFVVPIMDYFAASAVSVVLSAAAAAALIALLAPRGNNWVIYNISQPQAKQVIEEILDSMGTPASQCPEGLRLDSRQAIRISGFALLRNVTVELKGANSEFSETFQSALNARLAGIRTDASPMAVTLLLVATAMLVVPLAMVAHRGMPELVRLLTDLLQ